MVITTESGKKLISPACIVPQLVETVKLRGG